MNEKEISDWPKGKPTDAEVETAVRKGSFSHLSPLERAVRRNAITNLLSVALLLFFIGWILAANLWEYDIVEYRYPASFTPVTSEQVSGYIEAVERHGRTDFTSYVKNLGGAVYYWEDIAQFRLDSTYFYSLPKTMTVTLIPLFENGTKTFYVERKGQTEVGDERDFLLTEQIRPGTVPGRYKMKINFTFRKPIGGNQTYSFDTGEFTVEAKRPLPIEIGP